MPYAHQFPKREKGRVRVYGVGLRVGLGIGIRFDKIKNMYVFCATLIGGYHVTNM